MTVVDLETGDEVWSDSEEAKLVTRIGGALVPANGSATFNSDGSELAYLVWSDLRRDNVIHRSSRSGKVLAKYKELGARGLFFQANHLLAVTDSAKEFKVKELHRDELLGSVPVESGANSWLATQDGHIGAARTSDSITIVDLKEQSVLATIDCMHPPSRGPRPEPWALNREGSLLAGYDGLDLKIWDARDGTERRKSRTTAVALRFVHLNNDEAEKLFLVERDGTVLAWGVNAKSPKRICQLQSSSEIDFRRERPIISLDGQRVVFVSGMDGATVYVWELQTGKLIRQFSADLRSLQSGTHGISSDGKLLAILGEYHRGKVWEVDTGRELLDIGVVPSIWWRDGKDCELSQHGSYLALALAVREEHGGQGMDSRSVSVIDVSTGRSVYTRRSERFACLAVTEEGRRLAIGEGTRILSVDLASGNVLCEIGQLNADVTAVTFDKLGQVICSCCADSKTVTMWSAVRGHELATFHTQLKKMVCVALSPNGRWLAAGSSDGQVQLWDLQTVRSQLNRVGLDWKEAGADGE